MIPKKIKILFEGTVATEVLVEKKARHPNDYKFIHSFWKYFQFDCSNRPEHYVNPVGELFHGYVIGGSGKNREVREVEIKILE